MPNTTFVGERFPFTPKFQAVVDAQYRFAISGGVDAFLGSSLTNRSSTTGALLSGQASVAALENNIKIPGYSLVDARIGPTSQDEACRIELWGRNVFNKFYLTNANCGNDTTYRLTGMPATYGVTPSYHFGA